MIIHLVGCETCKRTHKVDPNHGPVYSQLPYGWLTVTKGDPHVKEGLNYCSQECLTKSLVTQPEVPQLQAPQSKMRRFMLVDGETAAEYEGVKFDSGHVAVDGLPLTNAPFWFGAWDTLKEACPGWGVTWIDQEVSDASK